MKSRQRDLQSSAGFGSVADRLHEAYHKKKVSLAALRTDRTDIKEGALCSPAHIYVYLNPPILSKKNLKTSSSGLQSRHLN